MALVDNLIFMISPNNNAIASGGILPLTTIARRTGKILKNNGDNVLLLAPGYYKVNASVVFTAPATGDAEIDLQVNSVNVPGIMAKTSVGTADTEFHTLNISGIIRVLPFANAATLSIVNSGISIDATNIALDIEYLG